jgi:two-component system cell cycle response regulator DivK
MQDAASHAAFPPRQVLIVEDHELHAKLLRDVLDFYGYATLTAASGDAAIDIARRQRPHLILLDMRLPDIEGTEVAGRLKADPATRMMPIVAVTAFAMPGDRERCIEGGCDDYIAKPVSIGGILALVERYTARPPGVTSSGNIIG